MFPPLDGHLGGTTEGFKAIAAIMACNCPGATFALNIVIPLGGQGPAATRRLQNYLQQSWLATAQVLFALNIVNISKYPSIAASWKTIVYASG